MAAEPVPAYIIAKSPLMNLIVECADAFSGVKILKTCQFGLKDEPPDDKNVVAVLQYDGDDRAAADEYMSSLNKRKIPVVLACKNLPDYFYLLSKGAAEILPVGGALTDEAARKNFKSALAAKVKSAANRKNEPRRTLKNVCDKPVKKIIVIGSSTGGTEAALKVLERLPACAPPVALVQHMPPVFTRLYAERLNNTCAMSAWEAADGDMLTNGLILIAPGDYQMTIYKSGSDYFVRCAEGDKVNGHCPSADVLFESAAKCAADISIGVILTGMGADGARGITEMRRKGAFTIGQDENSCVVYGMPKVAFELGGLNEQADINDIADIIFNHI